MLSALTYLLTYLPCAYLLRAYLLFISSFFHSRSFPQPVLSISTYERCVATSRFTTAKLHSANEIAFRLGTRALAVSFHLLSLLFLFPAHYGKRSKTHVYFVYFRLLRICRRSQTYRTLPLYLAPKLTLFSFPTQLPLPPHSLPHVGKRFPLWSVCEPAERNISSHRSRERKEQSTTGASVHGIQLPYASDLASTHSKW